MPRIKSKVIRVKDPDGIWHDLPAVVSEEAMAAAERANQAAQTAQGCIADAEAAAHEAEEYAEQAAAYTPAAIDAWLDDHPEATTTVDFRVVDKVFPTVASMCADTTLTAGITCRTRGYYAAGDGGAAVYTIVGTQPSGFYETVTGGKYATLLLGDTCNVKQFGAKGDGVTDDTTALNNAVLYGAETVYFPEGTYSTEGINCRFKNKTLIGYGATLKSNVTTRRVARYSLISNYPQGRTWSSTAFDGYCNIYGLTLDGNKDIYDYSITPNANTGAGIALALYENVNIRDCHVKNTVMAGILTRACNDVLIDNCECIDISADVDKTGSLDYIWDAISTGSAITVNGETVNIICKKSTIQNCKVIRSLSGGISAHAVNSTICDNYIENNGGYGTEDGFIASTAEPSITGYTFIRNIVRNTFNKINLQAYHLNDRFKGNDLILNFSDNTIISLGGATLRGRGASTTSDKNGWIGCLVTPSQTKAYITIKNNTVFTENTSLYSVGKLIDIVGAEELDISGNNIQVYSSIFNGASYILSKNIEINGNRIVYLDNVTTHAVCFTYASTTDLDTIIQNLEIKGNYIVFNYTGSTSGPTIFNSSPSGITNKIKRMSVIDNIQHGTVGRFFATIAGTIEKAIIKNNIVDADYVIANRNATTITKGTVSQNVATSGLLLQPSTSFTVQNGIKSENYPVQS